MPNLLRFPVVLIALLSSLYWAFHTERSTDEESAADPTHDRLVLRVPAEQPEPPLPPAKPRRKGPRRAAIHAKDPHHLTSSTGAAPVATDESPDHIRAQIRGISPVPDPNPKPSSAPIREHPPSHVTHVLVDGDNLKRLASKYLGDADRYYEIFEANPDVLRRPDVLPLGKSLQIPLRNKAQTSRDARPTVQPDAIVTKND